MAHKKITKYNINQSVFFMEDNKIKNKIIVGIYIATDEKGNDHTMYCFDSLQSPSKDENKWIREVKIFPSKGSLLNNL